MSEREKIRRAEQAQQILDSPLWGEAWDAYRGKLLAYIEQADVEDVEGILRAKRLLLAVTEARNHFAALLRDGKVAIETVRMDDERKRWWQSTGTR